MTERLTELKIKSLSSVEITIVDFLTELSEEQEAKNKHRLVDEMLEKFATLLTEKVTINGGLLKGD